jgi:ribose transport system permease protein
MSRSAHRFYKWLGFALAVLVSGIGAILGWVEDVPHQHVIFYTAATFALILWGWHHCSVRWIYGPDAIALQNNREDLIKAGDDEKVAGEDAEGSFVRSLVVRNKGIVIGIVLLIILFIAVAVSVDGFFTPINILASLVFAALLALATVLNRYVTENKSAFIGISVLIGLFIVGSVVVDGFFSTINLKSMLVFASFLGLACLGQTLVVLLGGLDLSIPFVIGSANIALMYLFGFEVLPNWIAVIVILFLGTVIGFINGLLSFRLQGQALIVSLGVGFAVAGGTQIVTSIGTRYAGNVHGAVPVWLTNIAAMNGTTFGLNFPPVILIWIVVAVLLVVGMRITVYGRNLYALGGSRTAAKRLSISERKYWVGVYTISGFIAALTGELLLGWSGSGFIGVGDPYLFTTLAAVVIGGTSLLGGWGGYGFTVIGVLVLQVLTSFLVGIGLDYEGQQFVFGLLIIPLVALYARSPHIRTQI